VKSTWHNVPRTDCPHCERRGYVRLIGVRATCPYCFGKGTVVHADCLVYLEVKAIAEITRRRNVA
jgi:hypothetical protein